MADETKQLKEIKQQDVDAVTEKLKEWVPTLPEQEQLVMRAARREHHPAVTQARDFLESEDVPVEMDRAGKVRHVEHDVTQLVNLHGTAPFKPVAVPATKRTSCQFSSGTQYTSGGTSPGSP